MKKKQWIGSFLLLLTAMIWGTAFAFQRAGMDHIGPMTFTASRMTLAAAAVGGVSLLRKRPPARTDEAKKRARSTLAGGAMCGTFLALASIFQQMGIVSTPAGKAGFITALYILLVPVIGSVFFGRRNPWPVWLAVLLGVAGMYLLCVKERIALTPGDALLCVCAVLFSGHILCCDHFANRGDPVRISFVQFLTAALIAWAAAFLTESPGWDQLSSALVPILYCGVVSGGIGYTLQLVAQKYTDPTVASLLMSLEAVFAVIAGALLLNERMTGRELAGCGIMLAAIVIVQIPMLRKGKA
ncbi:MAG: DMT family transporter [Clostridiales bacterium]|nr:DMT family transporter [Clostridiales bacterium]